MSEEFSLKEIIERNHKELRDELLDIKEQVTKTNGRVKALELFKAQARAILAIITIIIVPLLINYISVLLSK